MVKQETAMRGKFVAYYRVSTARQGASGLGLEAQKRAVASYLNGGAWTLVEEFTEIKSAKGEVERPKLVEAMQLCKLTGARLIIAKLDRLSRDVEFLARLQKSSVKFVALDCPEANELTVHIMAAMAQYERQRISERTKAALEAAKRRGVKLGPQPEGVAAIIRHGKRGRALALEAKARKADAFAQDVAPIIEALVAEGVSSTPALASALNARGIRSARGCEWTPAGVGRVRKRLQRV
jgi:DNA invertase Pin-like site-specific DNA recombinase